MIVTSEHVDVGGMRMLVTRPAKHGTKHSGIVLYSDIFQITGPQERVSRRLAGYGFVVATPEIWHRLEKPGTAIPFDDAGRTRGLENAKKTAVADIDADCRAALDWLAADRDVEATRLGAMGFCIGGHLAFRAALQKDVKAAACFYPTGVHDGKLGKDDDAGTLARAKEIGGELLLVFGTHDPHVPEPARQAIAEALTKAKVRFTTKLYDAAHAFMRDEGPRWDPEAADEAWAEGVRFLRKALV
jgi:carboxymethylenebutenolidase